MPFTFAPLPELPDVLLVTPRRFSDSRGWFEETWKESEFASHGIGPFRQDNHSHSRHHVLRGLHYQAPPMAQGKLIRCTQGEILDVAVDLRQGSPTYARHARRRLDADTGAMLWIPPGFAHGFLTLSNTADVHYKATNEYSPQHERILRWDDPQFAIDWGTTAPVLAPKDAAAPALADQASPFRWVAA